MCSNLKTVVSPLSTLPTSNGDPFGDFSSNATLYVPVGSKSSYSANIYWGKFREIIDEDMVSMSPENAILHFRIISEEDKTCEVYRGVETAALDGYDNGQEGYTSGSVTIPSSVQGYTVTRIGDYAFYQCNTLNGVNLPATIREIGSQAFYMSGLRGSVIVLPEGFTTLADNAFANSTVDNIIIPSTLTAISNQCFLGCPIQSLVIPTTVESIGTQAFNQLGSQKVMAVTVFRSAPLPVDADCFTPASQAVLYVPAGSKAAYAAAPGWNKFPNIVEMEMGGKVLGDADGNGRVTIADVTTVINVLLGK